MSLSLSSGLTLVTAVRTSRGFLSASLKPSSLVETRGWGGVVFWLGGCWFPRFLDNLVIFPPQYLFRYLVPSLIRREVLTRVLRFVFSQRGRSFCSGKHIYLYPPKEGVSTPVSFLLYTNLVRGDLMVDGPGSRSLLSYPFFPPLPLCLLLPNRAFHQGPIRNLHPLRPWSSFGAISET